MLSTIDINQTDTNATQNTTNQTNSLNENAEMAMERVTDVALHFVGPLSGSSPALVLAMETQEGDVYVYELHRSPEEILYREARRKKGMNIDLSSVKLDDAALLTGKTGLTGKAGKAGLSAGLTGIAHQNETGFSGEGENESLSKLRHIMGFVRVSHNVVTRPVRQTSSDLSKNESETTTTTTTTPSFSESRCFDRISHVNGQSTLFYRGYECLWITSERGQVVVHRSTLTDNVHALRRSNTNVSASNGNLFKMKTSR